MVPPTFVNVPKGESRSGGVRTSDEDSYVRIVTFLERDRRPTGGIRGRIRYREPGRKVGVRISTGSRPEGRTVLGSLPCETGYDTLVFRQESLPRRDGRPDMGERRGDLSVRTGVPQSCCWTLDSQSKEGNIDVFLFVEAEH